jgi:DnaK suppressor protein
MAAISALSAARRAGCAESAAAGAASFVPGPADLAGHRAGLEARWRETLELVTTLSVAYHDAAAGRVPGPPAATAQAGEPKPDRQGAPDVSRLARRVVAERQLLAEIEAALDRIAAGEYGRCEQCRRPITAAVLAASPEARFCSACASRAARLLAYA